MTWPLACRPLNGESLLPLPEPGVSAGEHGIPQGNRSHQLAFIPTSHHLKILPWTPGVSPEAWEAWQEERWGGLENRQTRHIGMLLPWELWVFSSKGYIHSPKHQAAILPIFNVPLELESSPNTLHLVGKGVGNVVMWVFLFWEHDGCPQTLAGTIANNNSITKLMDKNTSLWVRKSQGQQKALFLVPHLPHFCLRGFLVLYDSAVTLLCSPECCSPQSTPPMTLCTPGSWRHFSL